MNHKRVLSTYFRVVQVVMGCGLCFLGFSGQALAACPAQSTARGTSTSSFSVPSAGSYRVWSRLKAPDTSNNSFILEIDGSTCGIVVGDSSLPANSWTWVNYQSGTSSNFIDVSLAAGNHSMTLIGREDNVAVDRVILTTDTTCVPSNSGDNCIVVDATPPASGSTTGTDNGTKTTTTLGSGKGSAVTITASSQPLTVASGTAVAISPAIAAADVASVAKVEYYIDDKLVDTETRPPFTYQVDTSKLSGGAHKLVTKVIFKDGKSKSTTQTLTVKNTAYTAKKSHTTIWVFIGLVIVGSLAALFFWFRSRKGLHWRGFTIVRAAPHHTDEPSHVITSARQVPAGNELRPGTIIEHQTDSDNQLEGPRDV